MVNGGTTKNTGKIINYSTYKFQEQYLLVPFVLRAMSTIKLCLSKRKKKNVFDFFVDKPKPTVAVFYVQNFCRGKNKEKETLRDNSNMDALLSQDRPKNKRNSIWYSKQKPWKQS